MNLIQLKRKRYVSFKETGQSWLGDIPSHWDLIKGKYLFFNSSVKNFPNEPILSVTQNNGVVPRTELEGVVNVSETADLSGFKLVKPGQFVISLRSFQGGIELSYHRGIVSPAYTVMTPSKLIHHRFYYYLLKSDSFISKINSLTSGIRDGKTISYEDFSQILIPVPCKEEQEKIANYLDCKTSKLDQLVEKKEKLITLLQEKRQALISHAVTKGLDPNVPMKDSGIEWLGEVPESWNLTRLGFISSVIDPQPDHRAPAIAEGEGFPYIGIRDINSDGTINVETARKVEEEAVIKQEKSFTIERGDIVFCKVGTIGYPRKIKPHCRIALSATLVLIKANKKIVNDSYLRYALDSKGIYIQIDLLSTGSTRANLGIQLIRKLLLCLPSLEEQLKIASFLDHQTKQIDTLIAKLQLQISKIKEYRQALISAAVTGKIDVREEV